MQGRPEGPPPLQELAEYLDTLSRSSRSKETLLDGGESLIRGPAFLIGGMRPETCVALMGNFNTGSVMIYTLQNASVSIDGLVLHNGVGLTSFAINQPANHAEQMLLTLPCSTADLPTRHIPGSSVIPSFRNSKQASEFVGL